MARISLLLLIGSLLALAPSSLGQFGPQQHPCRCDKTWSFQLNTATICNWNTVDQYMMYMGQDVNFAAFPFGSCSTWSSGNMRCACTHIQIWDDDNAPAPADHFLVYWMPQNVYFPPGATLVWEWPKISECQDPVKRPKPYPYNNWWQIQQLDGQNRMGPMYCVVGAQILPWTSWVPSPVYPPYQNFPQYTAADPDSSTLSRSAQGGSARGPIDYNSTEVLDRIHAQMSARREQVDEAEAAYNALDSDDPRIDKDFVRRMILARNLTRPIRD